MKKQKNKPLFWITGNYYECQKYWKGICAKLKDPNIVVLECGRNADNVSLEDRQASAGAVIKMLKKQDIFDKRPRIIKMKGIPPDYALITDYFYLVKGTNVLVIDGPIGMRAKGPSNKWVSVKTSKFYKEIKAKGQVKEYDMEAKTQSQAVAWIKGVAKELDRVLELETAQLLVEMKGKNYDVLHGALVLMCDYQPKGALKKEVVEELFTPTFQRTVWDLVGSIDKGDYVESVAHLQRFYDQGEILADSAFMGEVEQLLGALAHHFTFLLMARDGCNGVVSYNAVFKSVEGMKKPKAQKAEDKKKGIWKEPFADSYSTGLIKMSLSSPALRWSASRLYNAQRDVSKCRFSARKTFGYSNRPGLRLCLDTLIMTLCGEVPMEYAAMSREAGEEMGVDDDENKLWM